MGYRYRTGGRGSGRVQRGGFVSEQDARESLERALERVRRANGTGTTLTLAGLVDEDLAQHDAQRETIEKLRWLLAARMLLVRAASRGVHLFGLPCKSTGFGTRLSLCTPRALHGARRYRAGEMGRSAH